MPQSPPDFAHRLGDVDGAVGAEEGAEAEVDDADAGAGPGARVRRGRQRARGPPVRGRGPPVGGHSARRCAQILVGAACARAGGALAAPALPALLSRFLDERRGWRGARGRGAAAGSAGKPASVDGEDGAVDVAAAGEARKTAAPAMSEGSPQRPAGMRSRIARRAVGVGAQGLGVVGLDVAGRDGVDVDALAPPTRWRGAWSGRRRRAWRRCRRGCGCRPGRRGARRC